MSDGKESLIATSGRIVAAYVSHNAIRSDDLTRLIGEVHLTLRRLSEPNLPPAAMAPAVPVRRSIRHDRLTCLECGQTFKSLKRHLRVQHGLSDIDYRSKWDLPRDYPLVAPDYAARRSELAKSFGLGLKKIAPRSGRQRS